MQRESFIMRHELDDVFELLSDEQVGKLTRALMSFSKYGVVPDLDPMLNIIFIPMMQTLTRDIDAYEKRCRKNAEAAAKRWGKSKQAKKEETDLPEAEIDNDPPAETEEAKYLDDAFPEYEDIPDIDRGFDQKEDPWLRDHICDTDHNVWFLKNLNGMR